MSVPNYFDNFFSLILTKMVIGYYEMVSSELLHYNFKHDDILKNDSESDSTDKVIQNVIYNI